MTQAQDSSYRSWLTSIRISGRLYLHEKAEVQRIEKEHPDFKNMPFSPDLIKIGVADDTGCGELELYQYLLEDIARIEKVFEAVENLCGTSARQILWHHFIELDTQEDLASRLHISRRQLQYAMNKWMKKVYDDGQ
ncbi:hypothetical protein MOZ60_00575 [Stecheria sp. CLA-KB-P133]|uniref:Uncharacterized protein n=1 Tax=Grylomicrobium aquisgranensis TaxID=2926318 RepID=A0AB35U2U9_9FIRM|nr:hypothetical protein [Stecheria sp. CLA-KB-P133]